MDGVHDAPVGEGADDGLDGEGAPHAVGADRQHVAVDQRDPAGELDLRRVVAAQAAEDAVAPGVHGGGLGVEQALVEHQLDAGVVAGLGGQLALADHVEPGVAGVGPVGHALLHQAGHDGGARHVGELLVEGVVEDRVVGVAQHPRKEQHRVGDLGAGFLLEGLGDELHGNLGGDLPVQVAPHAVGEDEQQRVAGVRIGDAVLVGPALADPAFLENGESHVRPIIVLRREPSPSSQVFCWGGASRWRWARTFCKAKQLWGRFRGSS